jgi:hypothetical protein
MTLFYLVQDTLLLTALMKLWRGRVEPISGFVIWRRSQEITLAGKQAFRLCGVGRVLWFSNSKPTQVNRKKTFKVFLVHHEINYQP